jgi:hypothetical protein
VLRWGICAVGAVYDGMTPSRVVRKAKGNEREMLGERGVRVSAGRAIVHFGVGNGQVDGRWVSGWSAMQHFSTLHRWVAVCIVQLGST